MKTTEEMIAVMQAFLEGKKIESYPYYTRKFGWCPTSTPIWDWRENDYRVVCDRMMTNRELAELLAKGYGQVQLSNGSYIYTAWDYWPDDESDGEVGEHTVVRRWGENEWRKATVGIYREFLK